MQKTFLFLLSLCVSLGLQAQLIITDPAAPTDDQAVTITFDATQGTGGLANCNCDVYLHTGVITNNSSNPSDWKYVQTEWGVANADWKLTPVAGEPNKFTYTYGPSIREYFSVPAGEEIQKIAFVFRNADGTMEGKATGGADIFVDVSAGGGALGLTVVGNPGQDSWPLGKPLSVLAGATAEATLEIYDNETLVTSATSVELASELVFTTPGEHIIRFVARRGAEEVSESFTLDAVLVVEFTEPSQSFSSAAAGESVSLIGTSYVSSDLLLTDGTNTFFSATATDFSESVTLPDAGVMTYTINSSYLGETAVDRVTFVTGEPEIAEPPAGQRSGAVDGDNGEVTLQLRAPGKSDVFVIGNFNQWTPTAESRMKRSADGSTFWITLSGLEEGEDLLYQYLIDGDLRQPDPYSTLVLDPNNDPFITEATFAGIPDYPSLATTGIISWHRRSVAPYDWQTEDAYDRPDPERMVVYELLIRDFLEDHSFKSLTDTLDYLERLGVNAIELMPLNEFEGNLSWGYNPSFHMALDKYYGSPDDFKAFVDACHARGMAVILDVVYNHAFSQSPLAQMWWDQNNSRPRADNPYLNVTARHPFNVGYDFNHESDLTKEYVKTGLEYWIEEFRIDGFRFDLSKGFTQLFSGNNVGFWNQYDASRVAILKDYADHIWSIDNETYMIMEHLAEVSEENELAEYGNGMYFWSGFQPHDAYLEASMGYGGNIREVLASNRGFDSRRLVAYMESHDEERMQFKNDQFGNSANGYNVKNRPTGLSRIQLASTFFYTIPGPKMLWQFGELGYDFSINYCPGGGIDPNCRVDNKPIRWDYRNDPDRQKVYNWIADLNFLRNNYSFFHGTISRQQLSGDAKIVHLEGADGAAAIVGNFDVSPVRTASVFPFAGTWYDYATGESITVNDPDMVVDLEAGEHHVYLDRPIARGGGDLSTSTNRQAIARLQLEVSPNPTEGRLRLNFVLKEAGPISIDLVDATGRAIRSLYRSQLSSGPQQLSLNTGDVPAGLYFLRVSGGMGTAVRSLVVR